MRRLALVPVLALALAACNGASSPPVSADPPELASWVLNTTGATGYGGLPADVQEVRYSSENVYVSSSDIPDYAIGPWGNDPNVPTDQHFVFRIPRAPAVENGTKTATPLGPVGVWVNGVAVFNAKDARTYNDRGVWHSNAVTVETGDFDACLGHPAPGGAYHHHQNLRCLYDADSTVHSPILGFAFDGYPIYGPYAYANADGTGAIARMRSGYRLRDITGRTTLAGGAALSPAQYGPPVSSTYPLGYFVEDYEHVDGLGDLDAHNGRFAATPEYPQGTYAYYVTVEADGVSAYPYTIGPTYDGVAAADDITTGGHVTVSEPVTVYMPGASGAPEAPTQPVQ